MSNESRRDTLRWIVNLIASVLTALAAALGTASCIGPLIPCPHLKVLLASFGAREQSSELAKAYQAFLIAARTKGGGLEDSSGCQDYLLHTVRFAQLNRQSSLHGSEQIFLSGSGSPP